eukprot:403357756
MVDTNFLRKNYGEDMPEPLNFEEDDDILNLDEKLKEENYYKYHENLAHYDPRGQPYSYFYITVMGQVDFGEFMYLDGLQVHYHFVKGEDWNIANGTLTNTGQFAFKGQGRGMNRMVWNLPFEITFRTMTPFGWPQIVIYCTTKDSDGDDIVKAFGSIHVPIQPGIHKKVVRMFSPITSNSCTEFLGLFREGGGLQIDQPDLIANAEGREVSRVKAGGKVTINMQVTQRNMERHGYITTANKK